MKNIKSCFLFVLSLFALFVPSFKYETNQINAETITTVSIHSCPNCFTDKYGIDGRLYRILIPTGLTSYGDIYKGNVYDIDKNPYNAVLTNIGTKNVGGVNYHMINIVIQQKDLASIILPSSEKYSTDSGDKSIDFDKSYIIYYPSQDEKPGTVEEYGKVTELTISSSIKACNVAETFAKRWYDFSIPNGTAYEEEYSGYIYDVDGNKYDVKITDKGSYSGGGRHLRFAIPIRLDIMCIYSTTIFTNTAGKNIKFDFDYKVTYPSVEYQPATYEIFNRPYDLNLEDNILEGVHDFDNLTYSGGIFYKENDAIPSYVSSLEIKLTFVSVVWDNTTVSCSFFPSGSIKEFVIKRKTVFSTEDGLNNFRVDKDYLLTKADDSWVVEPYVYDEGKIKLGNTGNGKSWVTSPLGADQEPYKTLISFEFSTLSGLYDSSEKNVYYTGIVYGANDDPYLARLWLINPVGVVDVMNFKLAIYVASMETTLKFKKDTIFTIEGVSSFAEHIYFSDDYLVNYTANTSEVNVTVLGEGGGGQTTDVPPVISYDGAMTLYLKAGNCVPLVFATAKDYFNADVLLKRIYSIGTHDNNYRLLKGEHTLTLRADDKYGNSSSIVIALIVE